MIGVRVPNWQIKFADFIKDNLDHGFEWGSFDCFQFCVQTERTITGETRWESHEGGYTNKLGAAVKIRKSKADSLWELVDQRMERKSPLMAQRGDWVGHITPEGEAMGIMDEKGFWAVGEDGLKLIHRSEAKVAWSL